MSALEIYSALLYGFIQGVTEFLPVSSSGHLALIPKFLHWKDPGVAFDLWMHVGTALAVLVYFYRQIFPLIGELGKTIIRPLAPMNSDRAYLFNIIIATGVTGVLALSVKHLGESVGRLPAAIGINLILFGLFMFGADFIATQRELAIEHEGQQRKNDLFNSLRIKEALFIGLFRLVHFLALVEVERLSICE